MMSALAARPAALIRVIRQLEELSKQGVFIADMEDVLTWLRHRDMNHPEDAPG
jgi:hypothetical protein